MNIDITENTRIANGKIGKRKYTAFAEPNTYTAKTGGKYTGWEVVLIVHNIFGGVDDSVLAGNIVDSVIRQQFHISSAAAILATINEWKNDLD